MPSGIELEMYRIVHVVTKTSGYYMAIDMVSGDIIEKPSLHELFSELAERTKED